MRNKTKLESHDFSYKDSHKKLIYDVPYYHKNVPEGFSVFCTDEEFDLENKHRTKMNSVSVLQHRGPNINLKIYHKRYSNQKEKELFLEKIKRKKKTELCKNYELYKDCYYGDNCSFAHGLDELRDNIILPSYKTKLCKSFIENKTCNFGTRCSYQHKIM